MAGYLKCSNKIPTPIHIHNGLVDAVLRPKILGNTINVTGFTYSRIVLAAIGTRGQSFNFWLICFFFLKSFLKNLFP